MNKDIFDVSMQMEKEGEEYYRNTAERLKDPNAVKLLLFLAREEKRHFELIKTIKKGVNGVMYTSFLKEVKSVFQQMKEKNQDFIEKKATMIDVLHKALEIEEKSIQLYKNEAGKTENKELQKFLLGLKKEEDTHYSLISSWIEYYERPQLWLEQAEFTHLQDY